MKGILFGGCSFTWGQGLYFYYENINKRFMNIDSSFSTDGITQSMIDYKNSIRFANLVSNHFNTFYVTKKDEGLLLGNGGSEDETFDFFDYIFKVEKKYEFSDFDYVIIQLSNIFRNSFIFNLDQKTYVRKLVDNSINSFELVAGNKLEDFLYQNKLTPKDLEDLFINQMFNRLAERIEYYEERGIKVKLLLMNSDYHNFFVQNPDYLKKLIKIHYNNNEYDSINKLMNDNENMTVKDDIKKFKCYDLHPSKLCHQIIAESIIKNIENDKL